MIEKTFHYFIKIHNYSSISNKLFSVTTISLVLALSYFSLLDIDLFVLVISPTGWDLHQNIETKHKLM